MDVHVHLENKIGKFSSGDLIAGKIHLDCAQPTTILRFAVNLIGESRTTLTGAPGLLFSRREQERHVIAREEHRILPSVITSTSSKADVVRLEIGRHSFDFKLRVPWAQDCSSCPLDPTNYHLDSCEVKTGRATLVQLPPTLGDLHRGCDITYRIEVGVTTLRNMFKSRLIKTFPITVWPRSTQPVRHDRRKSSRIAMATARATILGPSSLPLPSRISDKETDGLAPAEILIAARFQADFQLTKDSSAQLPTPSHRKLALNISVTKLNQHTQDLYLQSFQMLLVGYTDLTAGAATHGEMRFWTLQSLSNIGLPVFAASDIPGAHRDIDSRLWGDVTLDDTVVPNFATCNLARRYELELLMGWQCRSSGHDGRVFFVQVRTPVQISSGMFPRQRLDKEDPYLLRNCPPATPSGEQPQSLGEDGFSAPPTYDEAICTTVRNGLEGFEMRNASSR